MNNYVPYVWRKDYSNNGPWPGKSFTNCARKSAPTFGPRCHIINQLLFQKCR